MTTAIAIAFIAPFIFIVGEVSRRIDEALGELY